MNPFAKKALSTQEVKTEVRAAIAENKSVDDTLIERHQTPETRAVESETADDVAEREYSKLSQLVDDDFPFDESQLAAIEGMANERYACLTGAAGTGKTTTTKKLVDTILKTMDISEVDMKNYWKAGFEGDPEDDYESEQDWIPGIAMCAYTGRATQMVKKNFPRDWHGNIMTIHRLLGFYPEFYEDWDEESDALKKKVRFIPTYNSEIKLPWDVILIDEAGMLGLDLWHQLIAACKDGCRIYMIGDINQLPPVHGRSIFGFAMAKWPSWELTHVHRQQGKDNEIVDNAWRILKGLMPKDGGRFKMIELKGDAAVANRKVRAMVPKLQELKIYDPIRDTIITPINGEDGARGYQLGQLLLNREFALTFNSDNPRYIIDGGRERKQFAVGDKVMATKNDWEAGITNGMTGIITDIEENAGYSGDRRIFGTVEEVNKYLAATDDEHVDFNLDDIEDSYAAIEKGKEQQKEKRDRGPASHNVYVRFGSEEHGLTIPFNTLSEVGSLMTAYVVTCHKMQGGESPVIIVILHDAHKAMLYREWLYTAVTRASEKCILLYAPTALRAALGKQSIKGATLKEKVQSFNQAMDPRGLLGRAVKVDLPESSTVGNTMLDRKAVAMVTPSRLTTAEERAGGLAQILAKAKAKTEEEPIKERVVHIHTHTVETVIVKERTDESVSAEEVDGGTLRGVRVPVDSPAGGNDSLSGNGSLRRLADHSPKLTSQWGAYNTAVELGHVQLMAQRLLTHTPAKVNPWARKLGKG